VTLEDSIKQKLAYEWKNVFRALTQFDNEKTGIAALATFIKVLHQQKVFLSREELRKLETLFPGTGEGFLDYLKLSQEMGLHKQSLDFIRVKS